MILLLFFKAHVVETPSPYPRVPPTRTIIWTPIGQPAPRAHIH